MYKIVLEKELARLDGASTRNFLVRKYPCPSRGAILGINKKTIKTYTEPYS